MVDVRVRRQVRHFRARVLMLAFAGNGDGQHVAFRAAAFQDNRRVFHRQLGADVAVDPLHVAFSSATARLVTRL